MTDWWPAAGYALGALFAAPRFGDDDDAITHHGAIMANLADLLRSAASRIKECSELSGRGDSAERAIDDALKARPGSLERINAAIAGANREKQSWAGKIQEAQRLLGQLGGDKTPAGVEAAKKLDAAIKSANRALADLGKKIADAGKFQSAQQGDDKSAERALENNMAAANAALEDLARLLALQLAQRRQLGSALRAAAESPAQLVALRPLVAALEDSSRELEKIVKTSEQIYKDGGPVVTEAMSSYTNKLREAGQRLDRLHNDLDRDTRKGKDSLLQSSLDAQKGRDALQATYGSPT